MQCYHTESCNLVFLPYDLNFSMLMWSYDHLHAQLRGLLCAGEGKLPHASTVVFVLHLMLHLLKPSLYSAFGDWGRNIDSRNSLNSGHGIKKRLPLSSVCWDTLSHLLNCQYLFYRHFKSGHILLALWIQMCPGPQRRPLTNYCLIMNWKHFATSQCFPCTDLFVTPGTININLHILIFFFFFFFTISNCWNNESFKSQAALCALICSATPGPTLSLSLSSDWVNAT